MYSAIQSSAVFTPALSHQNGAAAPPAHVLHGLHVHSASGVVGHALIHPILIAMTTVAVTTVAGGVAIGGVVRRCYFRLSALAAVTIHAVGIGRRHRCDPVLELIEAGDVAHGLIRKVCHEGERERQVLAVQGRRGAARTAVAMDREPGLASGNPLVDVPCIKQVAEEALALEGRLNRVGAVCRRRSCHSAK
eukprot:scaffold90180_cov75-Phaeocystis_antarctica.AAC.6